MLLHRKHDGYKKNFVIDGIYNLVVIFTYIMEMMNIHVSMSTFNPYHILIGGLSQKNCPTDHRKIEYVLYSLFVYCPGDFRFWSPL